MTDSRIKLVNEVIEGIELVKMYAWGVELNRKINE